MTASPISLRRQPRSVIRKVSLDEIVIDLRVQRAEGIDQRRVAAMAATFDPDAMGVLILSQRDDGSLVCIDGMHRRSAALQAGFKKPVDARVFTGLTMADEAALFLLYNTKKDPSAISRFKARVMKGEEDAVALDGILHKLGWKISTAGEQGNLAAIEALEAVYRNGAGSVPEGAHPDLAERTLTVTTGAWGYDPTGANAILLRGVGQLLGRFGDAVDVAKIVRELQGTQPRALVGRAKTLKDAQGGTSAAALAKILVSLHNNRRRTNLLPEWVWVR